MLCSPIDVRGLLNGLGCLLTAASCELFAVCRFCCVMFCLLFGVRCCQAFVVCCLLRVVCLCRLLVGVVRRL